MLIAHMLSFCLSLISRRRFAVLQAAGAFLVMTVVVLLVIAAYCTDDPRHMCGYLRDGSGVFTEAFLSLRPLPQAICLREIIAPVSKYYFHFCFCFLVALCLCLLSRVSSSRHCVCRCGTSLASLVPSRSWSWLHRFPRLATILALTLVLWQISFNGIRVGEASNQGPTVSNSSSSLASGGVATLPCLLLRVLTLMSLPPSPAVHLRPPLSFLLLLPSQLCCLPPFQPVPLRSSSQSFSPSGLRSLPSWSVPRSPSFSPPCSALLSRPLLS